MMVVADWPDLERLKVQLAGFESAIEHHKQTAEDAEAELRAAQERADKLKRYVQCTHRLFGWDSSLRVS